MSLTKWNVVAVKDGKPLQVVFKDKNRRAAKLFAKGFNKACRKVGSGIKGVLELCPSDELLAPTVMSLDSRDEYEPPQTHKERTEIASQLSEMNSLLDVQYKGGWHPVHEGTVDACNYRCEMVTYADSGEFTEFQVHDHDRPLNLAIAERLDGYAEYFQQLADQFRTWKPGGSDQSWDADDYAKPPHTSQELEEVAKAKTERVTEPEQPENSKN